jgi:glycosyltransferase involved in cell wall biosynthesis
MAIQNIISVAHFQRKPRPLGNFSVESIFKEVRDLAPADLIIKQKTSRYYSKGIIKRLYNMLEASFRQEGVNHVTGDVHFLACFLRKKKTILTILDCGRLAETAGIKRKLIQFFWFDWPISRVEYITAISEATKDELCRYTKISANRVQVIPVFVKEQYIYYHKVFNSKCPVILQIGTAENKNINRVIQALENIDCVYRIIGKLTKATKDLFARHNVTFENVERALSDEELLNEYRNCDILAFVSTLEGFGMPIVEANAIGRVVITSNTTSMPFTAGDAALLVDPFNTLSIREGFIRLIHDEEYRNNLIQRGFKNAGRFNKEKIADQYFELYRLVARNYRR